MNSTKLVIIIGICTSVFQSCNDNSNSFITNRDEFNRIVEIVGSNYHEIRMLDTVKYHKNISLNQTEVKTKCTFLKKDEIEFILHCFQDNVIEQIIIYSKDCIAFVISTKQGYSNTIVDYIVFTKDINSFVTALSSFQFEITKKKKLENDWFLIRRRVSLAN